MDEIRPRRRRPAPAPPEPAQPIPPEQDAAFREMVALGEEIQGAEPARADPAPQPEPPEPVPARVAVESHLHMDESRLQMEQLATLPAGVTRVCVQCLSRRPGPELAGRGEAGPVCLDQDACAQRAAASGIFPMAEGESSLAVREALAGAVPRPAIPEASGPASPAAATSRGIEPIELGALI